MYCNDRPAAERLTGTAEIKNDGGELSCVLWLRLQSWKPPFMNRITKKNVGPTLSHFSENPNSHAVNCPEVVVPCGVVVPPISDVLCVATNNWMDTEDQMMPEKKRSLEEMIDDDAKETADSMVSGVMNVGSSLDLWSVSFHLMLSHHPHCLDFFV